MSEYIDTVESNDEEGKRPVFLKVLCILTWVASGFYVISGIMSLISGPLSDEKMLEQKVAFTEMTSLEVYQTPFFIDYNNRMLGMLADINEHFYLATFMMIIVSSLGSFSAIRMWAGKRMGFHIYIIYCLLCIVEKYAYASPDHIHVLNLSLSGIASLIFIFMYSRNLKWMK